MMLWDFFRSAGQSPTRQRLFRWMVVLHLAVLGLTLLMLAAQRSSRVFSTLGDAHILLGIVEGGLLVGWRLAQWPKSQALEPLLLANLSSRSVMAGEQSVGIGQLLLLAASGVPVLSLASSLGWIDPASVLLFPLQTLIWGSLVGFGLVVWAYESVGVRQMGERLVCGLMTTYFVLGGLAGEHTLGVLRSVPIVGGPIVDGIWLFHTNTPFAVIHRIESGDPTALLSLSSIDVIGVAVVVALMMRSAARLEPHYVDRHYKPICENAAGKRGHIGNEPLSWWAVRRVGEYAGRVNLYLAGGTAILYAAFLLLGPYWPSWLGQRIFWVFEQNGGVAMMTTVLVILAAVPAAYQYGLWDSSKTDRCRRMETLLTTDLGGADFEGASWSASWSRGRGYFYSALLLWLAAGVSGRMDWLQVLTSMGAGWLLLILYFAIGFRQLTLTGGGTTVGFVLCVVIPLAVWGLIRMGAEDLAQFLPPGMIFLAGSRPVEPMQTGLVLMLLLAVGVWYLRRSLIHFDVDIRRSFEADLLRSS